MGMSVLCYEHLPSTGHGNWSEARDAKTGGSRNNGTGLVCRVVGDVILIEFFPARDLGQPLLDPGLASPSDFPCSTLESDR